MTLTALPDAPSCIMRAQTSLSVHRGDSMRFRSLVICVVLLLVTSIAGSSQDSVKIGIIVPLTGSQAAFGEALKNGYGIALDEINAKSGLLGKKLELEDRKSVV